MKAVSLTAMMRVGLFGGSFDPPHAGHLLLSHTARKTLQLDCVCWLVATQNPLKAHRPHPIAQRIAHARALTRHHPHIHIIADPHRYTIDTVRALQHRYPETHFIWLMGTDSWARFHHWQNWTQLADTIPIALYPRPHSLLRSMHNIAAVRLARYRLPAYTATHWVRAPPPAWGLLGGRESRLASSHLRG